LSARFPPGLDAKLNGIAGWPIKPCQCIGGFQPKGRSYDSQRQLKNQARKPRPDREAAGEIGGAGARRVSHKEAQEGAGSLSALFFVLLCGQGSSARDGHARFPERQLQALLVTREGFLDAHRNSVDLAIWRRDS